VTAGTTLIHVKRDLIAALKQRPKLSAANIAYTHPGTDGTKGEAIWLGNASSENVIPVMRAGTAKVDETISLTLYIQSLKTAGEGQEEADRASVEMFAEVQQLLAERPKVSPVIQWAQLTRWVHSTGAFAGNDSSHGSRFEVTVTIRSRLGG
jgi:hypothetical protein